MNFLEWYGKLVAGAFAVFGLLSIISAFTFFSQTTTVDIWAAGAERRILIAAGEDFPANWLLKAGIPLFPEDSLLFKGVHISPYQKIMGESFQIVLDSCALIGVRDKLRRACSCEGRGITEFRILYLTGTIVFSICMLFWLSFSIWLAFGKLSQSKSLN